MEVPAAVDPAASQRFWRGALVAGGFTAIPRWSHDPDTGTAEHEAKIPDDLIAALRGLDVPLSSVLLAGHAKVLAVLSGEHDVATGYVGRQGGQPLLCRLTTEPDSWRMLLLATHRAESELLAHSNFPVDDLRRDLGLIKPSFETVLDTTGLDPTGLDHNDFDQNGNDGKLSDDIVLWVGTLRDDDRLTLRVRYRTDVLDADCAARIAGYHVTALELMAADPDAEHHKQSLLSAEELHFQLEGLAGPKRELPDCRVHELFEQQVQAQPEVVAAVHGTRQWTYRELNRRANRLARALQARGLGAEGVVAVVTERNLDWMAAVLAIFKAGGTYLPIEPHFPADRIAAMLTRAGCGLVLTEPDSTATLEQALMSLPDTQTLLIEAAYQEDHAEDDLGVEIEPDQLAYIYFTSGSTGEPKGAMCEHAGMINHLFAKIDDLEIGEGQVVAQTAPQCFDISLWQLISAVLVGGRTQLIEQEVILDVQRFVDKIIDGRVNVMQVVPSYLEVVLSYLEQQPSDLSALRYVSVTGEALKKELTQRWFAAAPQIKLVNAYGLTETSDDTNHEVMDAVPIGRVPLGRPINNVQVQVVDEQLAPVPLGAPGEIVFSGICVGRGYINDPERTRAAFLTDPDTGERRYRSGDHGRWRPDGKLEFLGRRDSQLKIRGFRIELGEIENTLLRVPGVRDGAVVVAERADQSKHPVAFYSSHQPLNVDVLRNRLGESLPEYMVPSAFVWRERLPLTANSKIDKKALTKLAGELNVADDSNYDAPGTPTEQRLAAAWAKVLGIPQAQVGRRDHFFDRGGTSLSAVKLAVNLDRAFSLRDLTSHPVLADLAALVDGRSERRAELLQPLSGSNGAAPTGALICFPYAGGNAVNFQPMAKALQGSGLAVYAVELPGHDVAARSESFASMERVVEQVVAEITARGLKEVLLWGHSSGTALAVETAKKLQDRGVEVQRVFLAAQLLGDAAERRASMTELTQRSNADIVIDLSADGGYTELGELDAQRAEHVAAAYRHDCLSAYSYFADALESPPAVKLSAPVTVVVAADDPITAAFQRRYRDWGLLAANVELREIPEGGHYFVRTQPTQAAQVVLSAAKLFAYS
jgi:amino acid adenylation domain-containing protein